MQDMKNRITSLNDTLTKLIRFIKNLSDRMDKLEQQFKQSKK